ncbi:PEBP-like protein [Peniophora sp. CONT]|nr:PEBP-like protein [Peniophora sp. CONT]
MITPRLSTTLFLITPLKTSASVLKSSYTDILEVAGIVPDVLPSFAGTMLGLQFPGLPNTISVGAGLSVEQVAEAPAFYMTDVITNGQRGDYVVIIADPDAPTPQDRSFANIRHLVAPNMKIDSLGKLVNSTPALWDYVSPAPPDGSAPHRYTVLVYQQPPGFVEAATTLINNTNYIEWSLDDFASTTGLEEPVAGTFFLTGSNETAAHSVSGVDAAFASSGIVPDLIPFFSSSALLDISYPSTAGNGSFIVNAGMNLTVEQIAAEPEYLLTYEAVDSTGSFVLLMLDPDAPTPSNNSVANVVHLLAHGLHPSSDLNVYAPLKNTTPALADYYPPTPPSGSAPHRYTILLYAEPEGFAEKAEGLVPADRISFNLTDFVAKTGLGAPLAGNFFYSGQNITIS